MQCVHCFGCMVLDALCGPITAYPVPRVQSQVMADRVRFQAGGGAANTASALAQLGVPVAAFSKLGCDRAADMILCDLQRYGVDTTGVLQIESEITPFTFVGIHPGGDRTFVHVPGANRTLRIAEFPAQRLLDARFLLYQDLWVLPQADGAPGAALLREARARGVVTLLDECWGLGPRAEPLECMLPHTDYFLPSYDDMLAIYPGLGPAEMGEHLRSKGAGCVVLKMGDQGCLVCDGGTPEQVPSLARDIVDTTGAGDCFDAGFIAGLANGWSPRAAAVAGSKAAAACIAQVGGACGMLPFQQLMREGAQ